MLFLLFVLFSSPFFGTTLKYEILGAALELCHLKSEHFSPGILKFNTKHENNPFTLNCSTVLCTFYLYFMQARVDWVLKIFGTQVTKQKRPVRPVFPDYLSVSYDLTLRQSALPAIFTTQLTLTCSKSRIEMLGKVLKYVQR